MSSNLVWLFILSILWGPSFLFIKIAVVEIAPLTIVAVRVGLAAVALLVLLRLRSIKLPRWGAIWGHFTVMGLLAHAIPFALFNWSEQFIDSAVASILNGTTPLFTILFAHFFTEDERLTGAKVAGSIIGFQGLLFLASPSFLAGVEATTLGILAATAASCSYGMAMIYARRHVRGQKPLVAPAAQLTLATLIMTPMAFLLEEPLAVGLPSFGALSSLLALGLFGTAAAFVVYYRILESAGATYLSMVTYLVPMFGIALGVSVLGEPVTWNMFVGGALILAGVLTVNRGLSFPVTQLKQLLGWKPLS